jgi:hypothetical protein
MDNADTGSQSTTGHSLWSFKDRSAVAVQRQRNGRRDLGSASVRTTILLYQALAPTFGNVPGIGFGAVSGNISM